MDKFTAEQIQFLNDAWFKLWPSSIGNFDQLKDELLKSEWKPNGEQLYYDEMKQCYRTIFEHGYHEPRKLTQTEVGSDWIPAKDNWAIDALIEISSTDVPFKSVEQIENYVRQALSEHAIKGE